MSHSDPPATDRLVALAPDPESLSQRGLRAWTERMAVRSLGETYVVESESGGRYHVDLRAGTCSCPDHTIRGETCKHLRRVAIEITAGRVPPPGETCVACGRATADPDSSGLCPRCALEPGEIVLDRETGNRLVVVRVRPDTAENTELAATETTVADYPTNEGYPSDDIVVEAVYAADVARRDSPRRYAFPHSRLAPVDDAAIVE